MPPFGPNFDNLLGQKLRIPGHFEEQVTVEAIRPLGSGLELWVRQPGGGLEKTVLTEAEFNRLSGIVSPAASLFWDAAVVS